MIRYISFVGMCCHLLTISRKKGTVVKAGMKNEHQGIKKIQVNVIGLALYFL